MDSKGSGGDVWLHLLPLLTNQSWSSIWSSSSVLYALFLLAVSIFVVILRWSAPGGCAWGALKQRSTIPGPRGWPMLGSLMDMGSVAHRKLAELAKSHGALQLMAFSLGNTRVVIASKPDVARELLNSSAFADRPLKQSAQQLMFGRAIGFAPYGDYWRSLRRIAANHLFSPKRIASQEHIRQHETSEMLQSIASSSSSSDGAPAIQIRDYLQRASLNNIMRTVFGKRYEFGSECEEAKELHAMVREGFELLGAFNWADHLPYVEAFDPQNIQSRCRVLVPRVNALVQKVIDDHRFASKDSESDGGDFVDVLLSLDEASKLSDADMISVLWEMIFRGSDTTAILTEWILAEIILHPEIQAKLHEELDQVVGKNRRVSERDIPNLRWMSAVVKETLRMHPPGPLLSWARIATEDVSIAGHFVPAGTTAMVNMWAITHDSAIWDKPEEFNPKRFLHTHSEYSDFDIKGSDMRLAPFGGGRRVCPGRALGLATVNLWLARLMHHYDLHADVEGSSGDVAAEVDLTEVLKLSCEMRHPLRVRAVRRIPLAFA